LEVTGVAQSPAGVFNARIVFVKLTLPPFTFPIPSPGLLEIVTLFNDTVADGSVTLNPTWFAFIVVFCTVVNEFAPVATPLASVFVAISSWSTSTGAAAVPPKLSSAEAPPWVCVRNRFRNVAVTPDPTTKISGFPLRALAVAIPDPLTWVPGDVPGPMIVRFGIVTSSDAVGKEVLEASRIVSPADGHKFGGRVVSHAAGAMSFLPNTFCSSAVLCTVIVFVATTFVDAEAVLSPVFVSAGLPLTVAEFEIGPVVDGAVTAIVALAFAPLARLPILQVTVPELLTQPALPEAKVTPVGSVSVTATPVASLGPALCTDSVYVNA